MWIKRETSRPAHTSTTFNCRFLKNPLISKWSDANRKIFARCWEACFFDTLYSCYKTVPNKSPFTFESDSHAFLLTVRISVLAFTFHALIEQCALATHANLCMVYSQVRSPSANQHCPRTIQWGVDVWWTRLDQSPKAPSPSLPIPLAINPPIGPWHSLTILTQALQIAFLYLSLERRDEHSVLWLTGQAAKWRCIQETMPHPHCRDSTSELNAIDLSYSRYGYFGVIECRD